MKRKRLKQAANGYVGILACDIHFPQGGSLKDKRQHLRSLKAVLARRLGASVAEVGYHDLWQRSRLLLSLSSTSVPEAERALNIAVGCLEARDHLISSIYREVVKIEQD